MKLLVEQEERPAEGTTPIDATPTGSPNENNTGSLVAPPWGQGFYKPNGGELDGPFVEDPRKTTYLSTSRYGVPVFERFSAEGIMPYRQLEIPRATGNQMTSNTVLLSGVSLSFGDKLYQSPPDGFSGTAAIVGGTQVLVAYTTHTNVEPNSMSATANIQVGEVSLFGYLTNATVPQRFSANATIIGGLIGN